MSNLNDIDEALTNLYGLVYYLRVQNEVNKTLIWGLMQTIRHKDELIDEVKDSVTFVSDVTEMQIKQQWSEKQAGIFRREIDARLKEIDGLSSRNFKILSGEQGGSD